MKITTKLLKQLGACKEGIKFFKNNFFEEFNFEDYNIVGDFNNFWNWLKHKTSNIEIDENGNLIHNKDSYGSEEFYEYENGNLIHYKDSRGYEKFYEYENGNLIHYKDSYGSEKFYEYKNENLIHYKDSRGYEKFYEYKNENNFLYQIFKNKKLILTITKKGGQN